MTPTHENRDAAAPATGSRAVRAAGNVLVVAAFAVGISLPLVHGMEAGDDAEAMRIELRELAKAPAPPTSWPELVAFPGAYEKYYNDHFGYRRDLVRTFMQLKGKTLGVSPSPLVVIGTDGWLYFTKERLMDDFRGERRFSTWELAGWQTALEDRRQWLAERGAKYLFVVAPNKVTIHPEHLPPRMRVAGDVVHRIDQLERHLAEHSDFRILDLRGPMREMARSEQAYLTTDSHWNHKAAFLGYQEVMRAMQRLGIGEAPMSLDAFRVEMRPTQGDLARMLPDLDYPDESMPFLEPLQPLPCHRIELPPELQQAPPSWNMWEPPTVYACPGKQGVLLMFKDSFTNMQMQWFACHFGTSVFLSMAPRDLEPYAVLVTSLHPTVVVEQRAERNLFGPPKRLQ